MAGTRTARAGKRGDGRPCEVLLADDGSKYAEPARRFALMLADAVGARLTVVYVREPVESAAEAERKLRPTLAAASAAGLRCEGIVEPPVGVTNPGRRILAAAKRRRADVIVLGARGAGMVRKLLGSVSSYVVSRARTSVCVIR
jgi:nucleotide-binding universal stress UspA family protein